MKINAYNGESIRPFISDIADFRLRYFKGYPYMYSGDYQHEQEYLEEFVQARDALLLRLTDDSGALCGIVTACCFAGYDATIEKAVAPWFENRALSPAKFMYIGEIIIVPESRGQGLLKLADKEICNYAECSGYVGTILMSVIRAKDYPGRPENYFDVTELWKKYGYEDTGRVAELKWPTVQNDGTVRDQLNRLAFFCRLLK